MGAVPSPVRDRSVPRIARRDPRHRLGVTVSVVGVLVGSGVLVACSDGLPDKGTVVGTVVDARQGPRRSCSITRSVEGSNPYPFTEEAAATDDFGVFRWQMYPGTYLITAVCPDGRRELRGISGTVDVSSGADSAVTITVK